MMVGEKKIEQLIKKHCEKNGLGEDRQASLLVYAKGNMRWAITLFKMELWHRPTEEPKGDNEWIVMRYHAGNFYSVHQVQGIYSWANLVESVRIDAWCYLSDILPSESNNKEQ